MAEEGQQLIQLELNGENVLVAVDKDGTAQAVDEATLVAGDMVLQTMIENVQPGEAEILSQAEAEMDVDEQPEKFVTVISEEKSEVIEAAEKIASLPSDGGDGFPVRVKIERPESPTLCTESTNVATVKSRVVAAPDELTISVSSILPNSRIHAEKIGENSSSLKRRHGDSASGINNSSCVDSMLSSFGKQLKTERFDSPEKREIMQQEENQDVGFVISSVTSMLDDGGRLRDLDERKDKGLGREGETFLMIENVCSLAPDYTKTGVQMPNISMKGIAGANINAKLACPVDDSTPQESCDYDSSTTVILPDGTKNPAEIVSTKGMTNLNLNMLILDPDDIGRETDEVAGIMKKVVIKGSSVHGNVIMHYCNYCAYNSTSRNVFLSHVVRHLFVCRKCPFKSFSRAKILTHSEEHESEKVTNYAIIGLTGNPGMSAVLEMSKRNASEIIRLCGRGRRYFCIFCPYSCQLENTIASHMLVHLGVWECHSCGSRFSKICQVAHHFDSTCKPLGNTVHLIRRISRDVEQNDAFSSEFARRFALRCLKLDVNVAIQLVDVQPNQYYDIVRDFRNLAVLDQAHVYLHPPPSARSFDKYQCSDCSLVSAFPSKVLLHAVQTHGVSLSKLKSAEFSVIHMRTGEKLKTDRSHFVSSVPTIPDGRLLFEMPMDKHDLSLTCVCPIPQGRGFSERLGSIDVDVSSSSSSRSEAGKEKPISRETDAIEGQSMADAEAPGSSSANDSAAKLVENSIKASEQTSPSAMVEFDFIKQEPTNVGPKPLETAEIFVGVEEKTGGEIASLKKGDSPDLGRQTTSVVLHSKSKPFKVVDISKVDQKEVQEDVERPGTKRCGGAVPPSFGRGKTNSVADDASSSGEDVVMMSLPPLQHDVAFELDENDDSVHTLDAYFSLSDTYDCQFCEFSAERLIQNIPRIQRHLVNHFGLRLFRCSKCCFECHAILPMLEHMLLEHKTDQERRIKAIYPFLLRDTYSWKSTVSLPIPICDSEHCCQLCRFQVSDRNLIAEHLQKFHRGLYMEIAESDSDLASLFVYACQNRHCDFATIYIGSLFWHMSRKCKKPVSRVKRLRFADMKSIEYVYTCFFCTSKFSSVKAIFDHVRRRHEHCACAVLSTKAWQPNSEASTIFFCPLQTCAYNTPDYDKIMSHFRANEYHLDNEMRLPALLKGAFSTTSDKMEEFLRATENHMLPIPYDSIVPNPNFKQKKLRCLYCLESANQFQDESQVAAHLRNVHRLFPPIAYRPEPPTYLLFCNNQHCSFRVAFPDQLSGPNYVRHFKECVRPRHFSILPLPFRYADFWMAKITAIFSQIGVAPILSADWYGRYHCPSERWCYCAYCYQVPIAKEVYEEQLSAHTYRQFLEHTKEYHGDSLPKVFCPFRYLKKVAETKNGERVFERVCFRTGKLMPDLPGVETVGWSSQKNSSILRIFRDNYLWGKYPFFPRALMDDVENDLVEAENVLDIVGEGLPDDEVACRIQASVELPPPELEPRAEVLQRIWNCTILTLIETVTSPDSCKRSGLLPGDLIAVISMWKSGDKRCYLLTGGKQQQKTISSFVSISPPNPAALYAASCESANVFVLGSVLCKYQEGSVLFDKNCLMAFSQMWYFIHYSLVFYMRGGTVKMLYSEFKKDKYLSRTAILMDRLAKETTRDLPQIVLTQYQKKFPHQFCDFLQGFFQMLVEPNRPFLNTHDELSVEDLLRILKMCKIPTPEVSSDGSGTPSRNDVMQVLFNATPAALQKVSTCFELTLQQMRQNNLRDFWLKLGNKHNSGMKDVLTRLADRLDLDYAHIISRQCRELKSTFAADLICRLLRQSKHLTTDMFHDKSSTPHDDGVDESDNGLGRALIIDMVTRQTKLIIPGHAMETIPMESRDEAGEANETEVIVRGDVIGKIITLSQESGPDKDRLELMSHNCRKYDLLIIRDSGGIKKMSYSGSPGWEVTSEFSPSEAMFVFLRELLMSPIKIMQTDPIVVDITMCYRLLKHLKSEEEAEDLFVECDQSQISEPVLTLINGNENVTILIRCCSCVALTEFVEYLQRLAKQDSLDLSHATNFVNKCGGGDAKESLYQEMDVASHVEILNAKQGQGGDLEAVEQSVISYLDENARLKSTECRKYVRQPKANFGLSLLANCIEMNPDQGKSNVMKVKGLHRSGGEKEPEMEILQRGKGGQTPTVVKVTGVNKSELPSSVIVEELLGSGDLQAEHSSGKRAPVVWIPVMVNQFQQSSDDGTASGGESSLVEIDRKREIMIGIINEDDDGTLASVGEQGILTQDEGVENVVAWQLVDVDSAISQQAPGAEVTIGQSNLSSKLSTLNQVQKDQQSMIENMSLWSTVGSPGTPGSKRDRFPDWLIKQVDYGGIDGLQWVDKSQNVIRMPWKHASSSMWSMDDVELMRRWAVHTGKFAPSLTPNSMNNMPKNWKVNFRMSLNLYAQKMAKTRDSLICRIFNKPIKRVGKPIKLDI